MAGTQVFLVDDDIDIYMLSMFHFCPRKVKGIVQQWYGLQVTGNSVADAGCQTTTVAARHDHACNMKEILLFSQWCGHPRHLIDQRIESFTLNKGFG